MESQRIGLTERLSLHFTGLGMRSPFQAAPPLILTTDSWDSGHCPHFMDGSVEAQSG